MASSDLLVGHIFEMVWYVNPLIVIIINHHSIMHSSLPRRTVHFRFHLRHPEIRHFPPKAILPKPSHSFLQQKERKKSDSSRRDSFASPFFTLPTTR